MNSKLTWMHIWLCFTAKFEQQYPLDKYMMTIIRYYLVLVLLLMPTVFLHYLPGIM